MEAKKNLLCAQLEGRESPAPESQTAEQQAPLCWGRIPRNLQQPAYNPTESSDPVKPFVLESNPVHPLEAPLAAQYAHDKKGSISKWCLTRMPVNIGSLRHIVHFHSSWSTPCITIVCEALNIRTSGWGIHGSGDWSSGREILEKDFYSRWYSDVQISSYLGITLTSFTLHHGIHNKGCSYV